MTLLKGTYLVLLWLLFRESYAHMLGVWNGDEYAYCYVVLPVALYLAWGERGRLQREPSRPSWWGMGVLGLGALFYLLGELGGEYYTLYLSSWLMALGLLWLHLGWRKLRIIAFPLAFAVAMFPFPNLVVNNLSLNLKLISSELGCRMLQLAGLSAFREGNVIDLGYARLEVVDACSGLRYLVPLLILGVLLARQLRAPFWKRALLVLSVVPLTIAVNGLRVAGVGGLYQFLGEAASRGPFHDLSGWLIFMMTLGILLWEMRLLHEPREGTPPAPGLLAEPPAEGETSRVVPWGKSFAALLLLALTLTALRPVELRERVPLARSLVAFPLTIGEWQGIRLAMESGQLEALKLSDYLLADYTNARLGAVNLYVAYHESQRKGESAHSPSTCLAGHGWVFENSGPATLLVGSHGEPCRVMRALVSKEGETQLVYYWFPQRGRVLTGMLQLKLYAFWDALTRRRTDGALVRLTTPLRNGENPDAAERRLAEFARQAMPVLGTFLPGTSR